MITLEVLNSLDEDILGEYAYEFDCIYIGRSKKADLIFNDENLPLKFLTIKFVQSSLVVQSEPNTPFYFVNGKKLSGVRKLKINDLIQFGPNKIQIKNFNNDNISDENDLTTAYTNLNMNAPELKFVLDFLEEQIIELESKEMSKSSV
jgi:pSer/pThr/pTyr-binding forkhead associated (FHA) protein